MHGILGDIGISIITATIMGIVAHRIKQPVILGYLVAGALIGPQIGFKLVSNPASIEIISEIGLILLLFVIGLEMNLGAIISSGAQLIIAGIGQFFLCVLLGMGFFRLLGYGLRGNLYLSLLCALSSTAIVVKLLYDKAESDTIAGRITLGVLIIQDIWAILILALQPNFAAPDMPPLLLAVAKSAGLLGAGFLLSKYALRRVYAWMSSSPEMVVAASIGWCALLSGAAGYLGLSMAMGALIAGVSISTFPYSIHVTAKTLPLRDFFLTLFFVSLGMKISAPQPAIILGALAVVVFVVVSRFITVYPLLLLSGAGRRTSFISSLNLASISEFSLVIASLGVAYGHIGKDILALITYSMALAAVISSYGINYNHQIFLIYNRYMNRLGFTHRDREGEEGRHRGGHPIVILGFHRGARSLIDILALKNPDLLKKILIIDFNLEVLRLLKRMNIACIFGDISSVETLMRARVSDARVILSTIPDMLLKGIDNLRLVKICRTLAPEAQIVAIADSPGQVEKLKNAGATETILPYSMIGEHLATFLEDTLASQ
jgi:Kef-type K+ transport system membrane component KefB